MISAITPTHFDKILKLNAEFVHWLAPLDEAGLRALLETCIYARQMGEGEAVLMAIASDAKVSGHSNFDWLNARRKNFVYIDRIIISTAAQGTGHAGRLYEDLAGFARGRGFARLTCEVNISPDNPRSHAFHLRQGFLPIGEQNNPDIGKPVRYYAKPLN